MPHIYHYVRNFLAVTHDIREAPAVIHNIRMNEFCRSRNLVNRSTFDKKMFETTLSIINFNL